MKVSSIGGLISHLFIIAFVIQNVPQSEALTPLETCQIVKDKSFIADPADCQGWYYCLNGEAIAGKCKSGLLYNSYTASCDYPSNVVCSANVTTMCAGLNQKYLPAPYNCEGYCYCSNGETECTTCPDGQLFDVSVTSCTYTAQPKCVNGSPCLLVSNTFIKNSATCDGWYLCNKGQIANFGACESPYYYDAFNGMCNYQDEVECAIDPIDDNNSPVPSPPVGATCADATNGFLPDVKTCRGYFYCPTDSPDINDLPWGQCPLGSQFSANDGTCTNPYNAKPPCKADRCDGSLLKYMAAINTACADYVVCSDNKTITAPEPCQTGYPFFDEKLGACTNTDPELVICTDNVPL